MPPDVIQYVYYLHPNISQEKRVILKTNVYSQWGCVSIGRVLFLLIIYFSGSINRSEGNSRETRALVERSLTRLSAVCSYDFSRIFKMFTTSRARIEMSFRHHLLRDRRCQTGYKDLNGLCYNRLSKNLSWLNRKSRKKDMKESNVKMEHTATLQVEIVKCTL